MSDQEILSRIQKVYDEVLGKTGVILTPEIRLVRSGEISSFIIMELMAAIEEEFDIELTYSDIRSMKTVRGLIRFIQKYNQ